MDIENLTENQKDERIDQIMKDLENQMIASKNKKEIEELRKKVNSFMRIKLMRQNLLNEQLELRKKYLMVTKERNVYFDKLNSIEKLGLEQNWEKGEGLLPMIREFIESSKQEI